MTYFLRNSLVFLAIVFMAGCSTPRHNVQLPQNFLNEPGTIVMGQISGFEEPTFNSAGTQGLLDYGVTHLANSSLCDKLKTIDTQAILNDRFYKQFGDTLKANSFTVLNLKEPLEKNRLADFSPQDAQHAPYDFRFLGKNNNANYALIIDPKSCGVMRQYYSVIPTSAPYASVNLRLYLVRLSDNAIISEYQANLVQKVNGEWDTPEYVELVDATKQALSDAINQAYGYTFL